MEPYTPTADTLNYGWREIEDLPDDWRDLCRDDLRAVHKQWLEDRALVEDEAKLRKLQEELAARWAVETGIIERLYHVDRGATAQIAQAGMDALGQFHARGMINKTARALITDQREALEMVVDVVDGNRAIGTSFVKELHACFARSQDCCDAEDQQGRRIRVQLLKGDWKRQSNNPKRPDGSIHLYCPPEHVPTEIERLLAWHNEHGDTCVEVEAAWLHHRFTQIHPFQDGNGRVARALASAVFLKADFLVLVIRDQEHRQRYLEGLESADDGDLKPLVDLFADVQIEDLRASIEMFRELRGKPLLNVAQTLAKRVRRRKSASRERAAEVLDRLIESARVRLDESRGELELAFGGQEVSFKCHVGTDDEDTRDWWSWQIMEAARRHQYHADLKRPRRWAMLRLSLPELEGEGGRIVLSLHAVGRAADLHAATMFLTWPLEHDDGSSSRRWRNEVLSDDPFRFAAETSPPEVIEKRFRTWFESNLVAALSVWGEQL